MMNVKLYKKQEEALEKFFSRFPRPKDFIDYPIVHKYAIAYEFPKLLVCTRAAGIPIEFASEIIEELSDNLFVHLDEDELVSKFKESYRGYLSKKEIKHHLQTLGLLDSFSVVHDLKNKKMFFLYFKGGH